LPAKKKTRHRKVYKDGGAALYCGDEMVVFSNTPYVNWNLCGCSCGMDVWTCGCSPETDGVFENKVGERRTMSLVATEE